MYKHGIRLSMVHPTRELAELWASQMEATVSAGVAEVSSNSSKWMRASDLATSIPKTVLRAVSSIPFSGDEIRSAAIPCRVASGIYFLLRDGEVTYVGQSVDVLGRISRHRRDGRSFDSYAVLECEESQLDGLERQYITALVPQENLSLGRRQRVPSNL